MGQVDKKQETRWLSLKEAAERLNVHNTTLRRWADEGQVPVMLTPGGHRRFAESDIDHISQRRHSTRRLGPVEQIWARHALELTREKLMAHRHDKWFESYDEATRATSRQLGQHLMSIIVRFMTAADDDDDLLTEAQQVGRQYGDEAKRLGLAITDALQASMFFRDTLIASAIHLPENVRIPRETQAHVLDRINAIINTVQLGIAEPYN